MNEKEKKLNIEELINMNYRTITLLGVATSLIMEYRSYRIIHKLEKDQHCEWFIEALNNVIYLNKPLPEMPE